MARPTNDEIRAAFASLGVEPGVTSERDARRAYRKKALEVHPDQNPDDPEAGDKFRRVTEALEIVLEHIKSGRGLEDEQLPEDWLPKLGPEVTIWEVVAPAGAGKTRRWVEGLMTRHAGGWRAVRPGEIFPPGRSFRMNVATGEQEVFETVQDVVLRRLGFQWPPLAPYRVIYAAPTIDLIEETSKALTQARIKHVAIHTRSPGGGQVEVKLQRWFATVQPDEDAVLLCSHAALMTLPDRLVKPATKTLPEREVFDKRGWDLTIDEGPEVLTFHSQSWPRTAREILRHIEAVPWGDRLMILVPASEGDLKVLRMISGDVPHETNINDGTREICRAIADPYRVVVVPAPQWEDLERLVDFGAGPMDLLYGGQLDIAVLTSPAALAQFRSVACMGARLDSTMYHQLWARRFNVKFRTHPLQDQLPKTHANGARLHLHYLTPERATRDLLDRKAESGEKMFVAYARRIADFYADKRLKFRQFIWTAPLDRGSVHGQKDTFWRELQPRSGKTRPGKRTFDSDLRMSGRTFGLNKFRDYHNVVLLSVVNFTPNQFVMLHWLGFRDREIDRFLGHNVAYQDALRCSLRVQPWPAKSKRTRPPPVHIIVVDRATADDLAKEFPGCTVAPLAHAPQRAGRKKPGPKQSFTAMTPAQKQRQYRARAKARREAMEAQARET